MLSAQSLTLELGPDLFRVLLHDREWIYGWEFDQIVKTLEVQQI